MRGRAKTGESAEHRSIAWRSGLASLLFAAGMQAATVGWWTAEELKPKRGLTVSRVAAEWNLGAEDWTLEAWLRLEPTAAEEGVILELSTDAAQEPELVTRFSVLPRENAFLLMGISEVEPVGRAAKRVEYPNPEGPPATMAHVQAVTLTASRPLPRDERFHVALVHRASEGTVRLFLAGAPVASAPIRLSRLPLGNRARLSLGCDGGGGRVLAGTVEQLRISDDARYAGAFEPAASLAPVNHAASVEVVRP